MLSDFLHNNRRITIIVCVVCVAVAVVVLLRWQFGGGSNTAQPEKRFYTVDDGASWFADSRELIPPFDHGGKEAVLVHVFNVSGTVQPGYLERFTPRAKEALERAKGNPELTASLGDVQYMGREVRAISGGSWVPFASLEGTKARSLADPNTAGAFEVFPR